MPKKKNEKNKPPNGRVGGEVTLDHDKIREWTEERGGVPAMVKSSVDEESGLLRIDFGEKEESLEAVSWDEFFKVFEEKNLAFLYQDKTAQGGISRFFKFVDRDSFEEFEEAEGEDVETLEDEEEVDILSDEEEE